MSMSSGKILRIRRNGGGRRLGLLSGLSEQGSKDNIRMHTDVWVRRMTEAVGSFNQDETRGY